MLELRACVDVDDLEKAIAFYTGSRVEARAPAGRGLGRAARGLVSIDLLACPAGSPASVATSAVRDYRRHWTPVHLDFTVTDLDAVVERARAAGATLTGTSRSTKWGRMANMADPFGHGFCLLEFRGRGYDELVGS